MNRSPMLWPPKVIATTMMALALAGCELAVPPTDSALLEEALPTGTDIPAA